MRVILSHDRSDFDAIASQIGLLLLQPDAIAVTPFNINANVQRFIDDHAASIPLRSRESVVGKEIEHAWYVDTDRASDLPGMRQTTPRSLLDHHGSAPRPGDEDRWMEADVQAVGACSTLVVERLIAGGVEPNPIVATLLLLAIHEDTGSLRFSTSTRRDAEAAGWLIETGANLDQLEHYLEKPLDGESRAILARLVDDLTLVERQGVEVAVAATSAPDFTGEVAPLAQRLLESQGAAAACALVDLGSIIQLSARSSSDAIDVGALAESFGGGGHQRAAAAAIEIERFSLQAARAAVIEGVGKGIADGQVLLVSDIMTRGEVVTLSANLTVGAALEIARRHGHEGFPVVDAGVIESMVERRDLDLAAHHAMLDLPLGSIIAPARVVAEPTMPAVELIGMMRRRGVVHVPVIENGALVGIVTRTDLIHALSRQLLDQSKSNPTVPLTSAFDPVTSEALRGVADVARASGRRVYLVGGIPRDLLLHRTINADIDLVVDGDAPWLGRQVVEELGGELMVHARFGTANWRKPGVDIDLVSARAEYYREPGQLPIVQPGSLTSDLRRRDFTINALAVALEATDFGLVIDRFGGLDDLRNGIIRMLHPLSFVEDATRIFRAVRFESRLGMRMSDDTDRAARAAAAHLEAISGARITAELMKLFDEPRPEHALERLAELGAMERVAPAADVSSRMLRALSAAPAFWALGKRAGLITAEPRPSAEDRLILWLSAMGPAAARAAARLDLTRKAVDRLAEISRLVSDDRLSPEAQVSELHGALEGVSGESMLTAAIIAPPSEVLGAVLRYAGASDRLHLPVDGADIKLLGIEEGPLLGQILSRIRTAWLDGEVESREAALAMAKELVEVGVSRTDAVERPPGDSSRGLL